MYLERIVETKKSEVQRLAVSFSLQEAEKSILQMEPTRGFHQALTSGRKREMGLIAEVKKASPSKGLIRPDFHPVELARSYEAAGADCISVLTDEMYFQGSDTYLAAIHEAVKVPLLRKDFIIDERQIFEARLLGADAVLLIVAILSDQQLQSFLNTACALGLDALVEVHDELELERALRLNSLNLIGINNRNLRTFETSLETTAMLAKRVPEEITLISESGIRTKEDMDLLAANGANGVLIGETFMRREKVEEAVYELMGPIRKVTSGRMGSESEAATHG